MTLFYHGFHCFKIMFWFMCVCVGLEGVCITFLRHYQHTQRFFFVCFVYVSVLGGRGMCKI